MRAQHHEKVILFTLLLQATMPWIKSLTIGLFCYIISGVLQDLLVRLVTTVCLVKTGPPLPRGTMH